jgi:hypothetical protein
MRDLPVEEAKSLRKRDRDQYEKWLKDGGGKES